MLDAELNRARAEISAREEAVSRRELETRTLAGLLAEAPLAAWNRAPDGRIIWSAGRVPTRHGTVAAAEAGAMAGARAKRHEGQSGRTETGVSTGQAERFRLELSTQRARPLGSLATVASEVFLDLDAPIRRLTTPDVPIPYNAGLMKAVLPNTERIEAAVE